MDRPRASEGRRPRKPRIAHLAEHCQFLIVLAFHTHRVFENPAMDISRRSGNRVTVILGAPADNNRFVKDVLPETLMGGLGLFVLHYDADVVHYL